MRTGNVWTTRALCDALAERKNLNTDYQLAKYMSVAQSAVSAWRKGARFMSDEWAERFAAELGLDPAYVCLCLAAERSTDANLAGQMRAWLTAHATAAAVVFAVILGLIPSGSTAAEGAFFAGGNIHYAHPAGRRGRLRHLICRLALFCSTIVRSSADRPPVRTFCAHG